METLEISRADLAKEIGASRSVVTNILNGVVQQSPYVPEIHRVLGWTPPTAPADAPPVTGEEMATLELFRQLSERGRARWSERGQAILEQELESAKPASDAPPDAAANDKPPTGGSRR